MPTLFARIAELLRPYAAQLARVMWTAMLEMIIKSLEQMLTDLLEGLRRTEGGGGAACRPHAA